MKKIFIGIVVLLAVILSWLLFSNTDKFDYVVTVDNEVTQLEAELVELEASVEAGTLTPKKATEAKIKVLTRLDTINSSVVTSASAKLTSAQQRQLADGLNRLKTILINYQSTLTAVDEVAVESEVVAKLKRGGSSSKALSVAIVETIEIIEIDAEEVVEDYTPDENLDEQIEEIINEENEEDLSGTTTEDEIIEINEAEEIISDQESNTTEEDTIPTEEGVADESQDDTSTTSEEIFEDEPQSN